MTQNPLLPFLRHQRAVVLDGGLATALEARGHDLNDHLWSARVLMEDPEAIRAVHLDYLAAGADCITTSSYQASLPGFREKGLTDAEGEALIRLSSRLAVEARDAFWEMPGNRTARLKPLVAASVGPYGAYLADGSEYTGAYGVSDSELRRFHEGRWGTLSRSGVDLLACETLPAAWEAAVLLELLRETPGVWAWMSFSCRDETHLSDGGRLRDAAALCDGEEGVVAVGINCTAPPLIPSLIEEARAGTDKPILVYPNSGERYEPGEKVWHSDPASVAWNEDPLRWLEGGCAGVGGCCRVGPAEIRKLRHLLVD